MKKKTTMSVIDLMKEQNYNNSMSNVLFIFSDFRYLISFHKKTVAHY